MDKHYSIHLHLSDSKHPENLNTFQYKYISIKNNIKIDRVLVNIKIRVFIRKGNISIQSMNALMFEHSVGDNE